MKNLKFVLYGLFLASNAFAQVATLDVHVHYFPAAYYSHPADNDGAQAFLDQNLVQKAFLISPSYHVQERDDFWSDKSPWRKDLKLRTALDADTFKIVQSNPERLYGLCGYSATWEDGVKIVSECLSNKGMIGIKIHSDHSDSGKDVVQQERINSLLQATKNEKPIVLWHLDLSGDPKEIESLYRLVHSLPETTFVFAHSFNHPKMLKRYVELEKEFGRLSNAYIEISTNWDFIDWGIPDTGTNSLQEKHVAPMKTFGMDRVLYGSDVGCMDIAIPKHLNAVLTSDLLTPEEKQLILVDNGRRLLEIAEQLK